MYAPCYQTLAHPAHRIGHQHSSSTCREVLRDLAFGFRRLSVRAFRFSEKVWERGTVSLTRRDDVLLEIIPHLGPDLRSASAIEVVWLRVGDMVAKWRKIVEHLIVARWDIGLACDQREHLAHYFSFGRGFVVPPPKMQELLTRKL
jgi:hypothetical protein